MAEHLHKFTIADEDAVRTLVEKQLREHGRRENREKLMRALDDALRRYNETDAQARQAFFHGLLTGYAVALNLKPPAA